VSKHQTIIDPEIRELRLLERQQQLTKITTQILRNNAKHNGDTVSPLPKRAEAAAPRAKGWHTLSELPQLMKQKRVK
jgi:hypothetical protein